MLGGLLTHRLAPTAAATVANTAANASALRPLTTLWSLRHRRMMSSSDRKFYILRYEYAPEILEKRGPYRAEHLENAMKLKNEGKIIMGGALVDPVDAGVFIFSTSDKAEIERFVENDPYVRHQLVTSHSIREWMVVV